MVSLSQPAVETFIRYQDMSLAEELTATAQASSGWYLGRNDFLVGKGAGGSSRIANMYLKVLVITNQWFLFLRTSRFIQRESSWAGAEG